MSYVIRSCRRLEELSACVKLQKEIWGYSDLEVYPRRLFVNLSRIGGQVLGAFTSRGELVGFVASMPAWRGRQSYVHSLSLGVLPGHENRGLGRALKMAQRRAALRAGVELIEWTFDLLQAKNAYFNLAALGAVARRYLADHYGPVASRLQGGLPSDRLIAEWWLKSPRVRRALRGRGLQLPKNQPVAEVPIPRDIATHARTDPDRARDEQRKVWEQLVKYFRCGLVITGFEMRDPAGAYLLEPGRMAGLPRVAV